MASILFHSGETLDVAATRTELIEAWEARNDDDWIYVRLNAVHAVGALNLFFAVAIIPMHGESDWDKNPALLYPPDA